MAPSYSWRPFDVCCFGSYVENRNNNATSAATSINVEDSRVCLVFIAGVYIHPPPLSRRIACHERRRSYPPWPYSISWTLGDFHGSCGLIATINDMELPFLLCAPFPPSLPKSSHFHFGARNISAAPSVPGCAGLD